MGGGVYDLGNLLVTTPLYHSHILDLVFNTIFDDKEMGLLT